MSGNQDWAKEFQAFIESPETPPPARLTEQVTARARADLSPHATVVFGKLGAIQAAVGALVLLFCPQFGINLIPGMGLMVLFDRFGEAGCMLGCGSVFLGASALVAAFALRAEEIRAIRRSRVTQALLMATLSSGVFVCLGDGLGLKLGMAWVLGSLLGGLGVFELSWVFRLFLRRRVIA